MSATTVIPPRRPRRAIATVATLLLLLASPDLLALPPAATEPTPPPAERRRVYRLLGSVRRGEQFDRTSGRLELVMEPAEGGDLITMPVPNSAEGRFSPSPQVVSLLARTEPRALVEARLGPDGSPQTLSTYNARDGEDAPRGHVFVRMDKRRVGEWDYIALHLSKYGQPREVLIPNRTRPGGARRPDARMWAVARRLRAGDVVMVWDNRFEKFMFASDLHPYDPPRRAMFVRFDPATGDAPAALCVTFDLTESVTAPATTRATTGATSRATTCSTTAPVAEERIPLPRMAHDGSSLADPSAVVRPGAAVPGRVIELTTRDEDGVRVLSEVRLPGIAQRTNVNTVDFMAGPAGVTFFRASGERVWSVNAHTYGRGDEADELTKVKVGLARLLDRPEDQAKLNLPPPVLESLRHFRGSPVPLVDNAQQARWAEAAAAWASAADRVARDAVEQEVFGSLLDLADRQRDADERRVAGVRGLLDEEQFKKLCELGR